VKRYQFLAKNRKTEVPGIILNRSLNRYSGKFASFVKIKENLTFKQFLTAKYFLSNQDFKAKTPTIGIKWHYSVTNHCAASLKLLKFFPQFLKRGKKRFTRLSLLFSSISGLLLKVNQHISSLFSPLPFLHLLFPKKASKIQSAKQQRRQLSE
jgi:hypothetical protein